MDRRIEPRFSLSSAIRVTLLSSLDRQIDCRMIDISAAGMRFVSDMALAEDEVVAVDFDDHLGVTRVRNCLPYGDKYSIGTARIHTLPKDQLPPGEPQWQHIRMMLEEKGWAVELGLDEGTQYPSESEPTSLTESAMAEPVPPVANQNASEPPVETPAAVAVAEPEAVVESKPAPIAVAEPLVETLAPPVSEAVPQAALAAEAPAPMREAAPAFEPVHTPQPAPPQFEPAPPAFEPAPADGPSQVFTSAPRLDPPAPAGPRPIPTLARQDLPPMRAREPEQSKRGKALAAAVIVLAIVATLYVVQSRRSKSSTPPLVVDAPVKTEPGQPAPPTAQPTQVAEATTAPAATPAPAPPAPTQPAAVKPAAVPKPAPAPKAAPTPATPAVAERASTGSHTVRLTILQPGWITATADGKTVLAKVLEKGTQDFTFSQYSYVHLGNSHYAEISLDGATIPPAQGGGALRLIQLTPAGARNIPWINGEPPAPR